MVFGLDMRFLGGKWQLFSLVFCKPNGMNNLNWHKYTCLTHSLEAPAERAGDYVRLILLWRRGVHDFPLSDCGVLICPRFRDELPIPCIAVNYFRCMFCHL